MLSVDTWSGAATRGGRRRRNAAIGPGGNRDAEIKI